MELIWLADTPQARRRNRALRACAQCQRRKKRCHHIATENVVSRQNNIRQAHTISNISPQKQRRECSSVDQPTLPVAATIAQSTSTTTTSRDISRTERFVGDLNPEAAIREKLDIANGNQLRDRIGLWISSPSGPTREERLSHSEPSQAHDAITYSPDSRPVASLLHQQYTSASNACGRLPYSTRKNLISIYFAKVNHILPLLDQETILSSLSEDSVSVFLERAICLVAAKDGAAGCCLRLSEGGQLVTSRLFCSEIYDGLVAAMNFGFERDRITRIRILALMSLHSEGYEGVETASMHLCQAIHQAQTVGLHLHRPDKPADDTLSHLFWCLWTLDRMHACLGGRPVLLSERDIGIRKPHVRHSTKTSAFDIWFAISDLLSTVISFYRPSSDHTVGWETGFPTFEGITGDRCSDLDSATLDFLELYYHAVCILSCRYGFSHPAELSKPSYSRQGLAAVRIHSIFATECSGNLPPLPIVPYALTLSMAVSYQQFRSSQLVTHLDRARAGLKACCVMLETMSAYWSTAEAMARLGRKALCQIEGANPQNRPHDHDHGLMAVCPEVRIPRHLGESMSSLPLSSDAIQGTRTNAPLPMPMQSQSPFNDFGAQTMSEPDPAHGQFADIDILFGEFLDLSLPTNFWDPVFLRMEPLNS
ncbi:transcription factor domain-containing protein [Aspergillus homomorphus CBS 101889]|uniref:Fungal-specific transcription factor n=1 Tax=Aspergillus homomorphus (strain CBS 101889) TaxID=1450537 RepID=A0A395HMR4_ASPHC|nr:fungal-specific transcription factor [Aspergillus homomorphus CBS 101889]RAL07564.1 fungal-specific transcription factor [Aspergillus homomorphus CBS 101889]